MTSSEQGTDHAQRGVRFQCTPCEAFQAVSLALPGGVPQACHVHRVSGKAPTVYAVVVQNMAVKAVVVPHFLDAFILKELLESYKQLFVEFLRSKCTSVHRTMILCLFSSVSSQVQCPGFLV